MRIAVTSATEKAHITVGNCKGAIETRPRSGQCGSGYFDEMLLGVTPPFVKNCTLSGEAELTTAP
jgi:hypothetical protein